MLKGSSEGHKVQLSVLITGVTGFIGSYLARRLVEEGYDVYGLVRHVSRSELRSLEPIFEKIRFVEGDITEYHSVRSAIASVAPKAVIHLAALTPVRYSFEDPFPYAKINFGGTMNFVHAILEESPNTKLIAASTAEVYGWQPHEPTPEDAKLNPSSPYAVSKVAADEYLQMAMKVYGLKTIVLRCNNTYGRIGERGYLVEYIVSSMLGNQTVYIGAPNHVRDYMSVDDHVDAYVRALENESAIGEMFNVSPGNPITNLDLAKKTAEITGFKGRIVEGSYPPGYPVRPTKWDTEYIVLDSQKIRSKLGWKPTVTLDEGLKRAIEVWRRS
jgi:nucleoside-diphosphate-sugar epimerase